MMKCLVTGGAGFIGSHLVDRLIRLGYTVSVIDNESSQFHETFYHHIQATYYQYDVSDYNAIQPLFEDIQCVFHLAAESRIQPTLDNPTLAIKTNVYGTSVVLQCAREAGVKKVLFSSTSAAYGLRNTAPQIETAIVDCLNPYAVSKVAGETLCTMYTKIFALPTIIFRYFNVYGPREPIKGPYAPVVGLFFRQTKNGQPLTIVGTGEQRRDFTHVDDVVEANILAMQQDTPEYYGTVFNVGSGTNYSITELANMISPRQIFIAPRVGEAQETLADIRKMRRIFGWNPSNNIQTYITTQSK